MKKTNKSPENTEVTPSKKKLKQARLPFMIVSDVSPKPDTPPSRKRKLSVPEAEPVTKVGKLSKDDTINADTVVISDEDSKGAPSPKKQEKAQNPYVKLVDTAWKKKLKKAKGPKKSRTRSSKKQTISGPKKQLSKDDNHDSECDDVEMVEVDVIIHEEDKLNDDQDQNKLQDGELNTNKNQSVSSSVKKAVTAKEPPIVSSLPEPIERPTEEIVNSIKKVSDKPTNNVCEIINLEDSNHSSDVQMSQSKTTTSESLVNHGLLEGQKGTEKDNDGSTTKTTVKTAAQKHSARYKTKKQNSPDRNTSVTVKTDSTKEQHIATKATLDKNKEKNSNKSIKLLFPILKAKTMTKIDQPSKTDGEISDNSVEMIEVSQKTDENYSKLESTENVDLKDSSQESSEESTSNPDSEVKVSTPKRSARIKTKDESRNLDDSSASSESMTVAPSTPKQNEPLKSANLTPKQLQKILESAKKKEEREKEKLEREKKRQQEKEERAKERQEKEEQKKREREEKDEAKKKEREEKEEQRRKEREEKEKLKELEKKAKELKEELKRKEKEDKEEQRRKEKEAREEEKRKRQEVLELEKQEQELKKKKAAEAFVNFFVPKQKIEREASVGPVSKSSMLSSFTIKVDMRLAPTVRVDLTIERREALDKVLEEPRTGDCLYLQSLKSGLAKPMSNGKTWPLDDKDDEVMIIEDELPPIDEAGEVITCESAPREKLRPKLLSFHENRRPPYWGTWRKKSTFVTPRRPFGQEKQLDYEVDSDDDWEDEQDGESLDGSAGGSDDEAGADDYEVDNEVFVPHGYLSDEEATMDEDDVLSLSPETQKARLKHLEDEFESELKKPTEKLKPRLYGLLWETSEGGKPEKCVDALWNYFEKFAMIMNDPAALLQPAAETEDSVKKEKKVKKKKVLAEVNDQSPNNEKKNKKVENKESKKPKQEAKKTVPNQPGINSFLKKVKTT